MYRVFVLYALSGFISLGYQVSWFRIVTDWFGSTNLTFALVICNFVGGLGAGALLSDRVTRLVAGRFRFTDGLRVYGMIELSVGVAATKYVAKVASGHAKPDGLTIVAAEDAVAWLAPMPVARLWGAGPKTQARMNNLGLNTIADVANADPDMLSDKLGHAGDHFFALAHARDPRRVQTHRVARSMGSDRTLHNDVVSRREILQHLKRCARSRIVPTN